MTAEAWQTTSTSSESAITDLARHTRLLEALDDLSPSAVLIEGPADASDLMGMLADPDMRPPVSLLAYANNDPACSIFWPFATYSPEYQAVCWAVHNRVEHRLIDWPANWQLARMKAEKHQADSEEFETVLETEPVDEAGASSNQLHRDPIGVLAHAAGYEDGESWWCDVIEENPSPGPVFEAITDAMTELRQGDISESRRSTDVEDERNDLREAHMRLEIAKARKETDGPIAVVCGAWHAPALSERKNLTEDRALLKGQVKTKISLTWAPWTSPRLAFGSGYGAGVVAPGWCDHLWHTPPERSSAVWLARIAEAMRAHGHIVSTASLIEAERLAHSLAAIRGRRASVSKN